MTNNNIHILLLLCSISVFSQQKISDTTALEEVVVTAQIEPQSIKESVFNVTRITKKDIKQQAANNLADLLNQYLNISISPGSESGRSTATLFGLDGRYFKILVDNIPLVTDGGMGNDADLTQIQLDDVEQIEIIEGSMGVTHGANAVTGILNIITKKSSRHDWEITATVQEETVGEEYRPFSKGRHIQGAKVSHQINAKWFASVGFNRNDFDGFLDGRKGPDYTAANLLRGYTWLPKEQNLGNAMLSYKNGAFRAFYKFEYMHETIDYYNPVVLTIANPPFYNISYANDRRYLSERIYNHLNVAGKISQKLDYNVSASYQKQVRSTEDFAYYFTDGNEQQNQTTKNQSAEVIYSTGTLSNFFTGTKADLQLGYELSSNRGYSIVDGENMTLVPIRKTLANYDLFAVSEIKFNDKFSVRPGLRFSIQSAFDSQHASSLGLRYLLDSGIELRASLGKSFRTPDFEELYSRIQFSGHQFYGNPDLEPESSTSYDFSIKNSKTFASGLRIANSISTALLAVNDRIDMAFTGFEPDMTPIYQYINISDYKMWNIATTNQATYNNWTFAAGLSYVGISQKIENGTTVSDDKFLFSLQGNANVAYDLVKYDTRFSVYFKYNGKQQQFAEVVEGGANVYRISEINPYSFVDASVRKLFFKKRIEATLGARNLLDVTRINQGLATGGTHTASNELLLGYGRSYFIKISYNLNF